MTVLGIHGLSHDAGAAVVSERGMWAISEERLSRVKYEGRFPEASIKYVLEASGAGGLDAVDLVVVDHLGGETGEALRLLAGMGYRGETATVRHHDAHAASAFFVSPFDDAAVLVVDAAGSWGGDAPAGRTPHYLHTLQERQSELQSTWRGTGSRLTPIRSTPATKNHRFGVGFFYAFACMYLGFGDLDGGKLMGLAAYGGKRDLFPKEIFEEFEGEILAEGDRDFYDPATWEYYGKKYFRGVAPRAKDGEILQKHAEIAAYVQRETERAMLILADRLHNATGCGNLCVAGGVGLNSVVNSRIMKETGFSGLFAQPASSDCGVPLGCALHGYHVIQGRERHLRMDHAFLGREYTDAEMERAIPAGVGLDVSAVENAPAAAADMIAGGAVVGWFDGASEYGPRALGHRSILADPRNPEMKEILNTRVKRREGFRPYAPAVLEERAGEFFELPGASPFMLLVAAVREEKRAALPAVTHVDGTARVQTVTRAREPRFRELIERFGDATGVPVVLNTSFNVAGEPIVETPADAVNCFMSTEMEVLFLGKYLLRKPRF